MIKTYGKIRIVSLSFVQGKKLFLARGYMPCWNPKYLSNGKRFVHYNRIMKGWIIE